MIRILLFIFVLNLPGLLTAQQETVIAGSILEKGKPEVLPFVSIFFKGTTIGTTSDFEGNFLLKTTRNIDTLVVSYIGYKTYYQKIIPGKSYRLKIELESNTNELDEVVIRPGINPALRILEQARKRREGNDGNKLTAVEYNTYSKLDVCIDNISEKMKEQKMFKPIRTLFDTVNQIKNDEGKYIIPFFLSETYSRYYKQNNPFLSKNVILANQMSGFVADKESYLVDIIGTDQMDFNFNQNWIRYLNKNFMSPIADNSMDYYIFSLMDSSIIDGHKCYEIKLNLRREEDLGFLGTMWITDSSFAIKRIQVELAKSANINFIDRFKIQQELIQTKAGPWIPQKTRTIIDISQLTKNSSGFIAKCYAYNSDVVINEPKPGSFFDVNVVHEGMIYEKDTAYWKTVRAEEFSNTENKMIQMIDSVKKLPAVKTYIDIFRLVLEGYYRVGKFDFGPYVYLIGYNEVEKMRFRLGFRTNKFFSTKWYWKTYLAYGTADQKWKYGIGLDRILSQKHWTTLGFQTKYDYDILGVTDASVSSVQGTGGGNLFATLSFASPGSRINKTVDYRFVFLQQPSRDWTYRITASNTYFAPAGSFVFAYKPEPGQSESASNSSDHFISTALSGEVRFAYKEILTSRGIDRIRTQKSRLPALTFSYTKGLKGVMNSDFGFDKIQLRIDQNLITGQLGNADYRIMVGKIYGNLPYPLLDVARGNSTMIYSDQNYSLMNLYEFIADQYSHFYYVQHFEGFFTNRIPFIRNWHLRNFALFKMSYGHLSDANKAMIPGTDASGRALSPIYEFKDEAYSEIGFGFENIFRIMQLGYVKRLTYLHNVNVRSWGITLGVNISF